jgi:hypothetical protein
LIVPPLPAASRPSNSTTTFSPPAGPTPAASRARPGAWRVPSRRSSCRANPGAGGQCVQEGIATLKSLGALQAAAQQKVDYSAFTGPNGIRLDLPAGTFLSLGQVVKLHTSNPELFAWCD